MSRLTRTRSSLPDLRVPRQTRLQHAGVSRRGLLPIWLGVLLGFFALLVVGRALTGLAYANRIYPGVSAAGLDLGGLTVPEATAQLGHRLDAFASTSVSVQIGDRSVTTTPTQLGFHSDPAGLAQASYDTGRQGSLLSRLAGPLFAAKLRLPIAPDSLVDRPTLVAAVGRIAAQTDRPALNASLVLDPTVQVMPSQSGQQIDQNAAAAAATDYLTRLDSGPLVIPTSIQQPTVTTDQLTSARDQDRRLLAGPVVLDVANQSFTIPPSIVRHALVVPPGSTRLQIDQSALSDFIQTVDKKVTRPTRDAQYSIADGKVTIVPDQSGQSMDQTATLSALSKALTAGQLSANGTVQALSPRVTSTDLQPFVTKTQKLLDAGLVLVAENQEFRLSSAELGDLLNVQEVSAGNFQLDLDHAKLADRLTKINAQFQHPSIDARFNWQGGKLSLRQPMVPAVTIDQPGAIAKIEAKWQDGRVVLPLANGEMAIGNAYLSRLNGELEQIIQTRTTAFYGSIPERAHNIALALSKINGTYVPVGATFSFNHAIGPTTLAAGFQWGFGYSTGSNGNSQVVPSVAGGICQVATTVFQPVFWAGYEIQERHWHMFAMHSYADNGYLGLDATVAPNDGLDLQFTNDSTHPVLILAWTEGETAHVELVGTPPDWTVKVSPEVITNVVPAPTTVVRSTSPLFQRGRQIVLEAAQGGLTAHDIRQVIYPDGHVRTLILNSDYQPAPLSILVGSG